MRNTKFSQAAHFAKAQNNLQFANEISALAVVHNDWRVTADFYAAVHILQGYFTAKTTEYPQNHAERDDLILRTPLLRAIYKPYRSLKDASVSSRYLCFPVNNFDVDSAQRDFETIHKHILDLLAKPDDASEGAQQE